MKETRPLFYCANCGQESLKWQGRCSGCGEWNSYKEAPASAPDRSSGSRRGARAAAGSGDLGLHRSETVPLAQPLSAVSRTEHPRVFTGLAEFDRVLGGGCVPGSLILLSGDPGVGKSTLVMQTLKGLAWQGHKALYASGEENPHQILMRAERLGAVHEGIQVTQETGLGSLFSLCGQVRNRFLVVDSIQTCFVEEIPSSPGSVLQVRECAARLMSFCKENQITCFVIGQVTKDGQVAGPRLLEHLVDTVLYLEGDSSMGFRMLRAMKNRFGSTGEIGVFSMSQRGLDDVLNPSALFLGEQEGPPSSGTAVSVAVEGTRPFLLELQVLVGSATYASPRRIVSGLDSNRMAILVAVLEKRAGLNFSQNDVFASVAGGLRVTESAHDLALLSALISSHRDRIPPQRTCYFGELSLSGDVRAVPHALARVREARMRGFERIFLPKSSYEREKSDILRVLRSEQDGGAALDCELYPISLVGELLEHIGH